MPMPPHRTHAHITQQYHQLTVASIDADFETEQTCSVLKNNLNASKPCQNLYQVEGGNIDSDGLFGQITCNSNETTKYARIFLSQTNLFPTYIMWLSTDNAAGVRVCSFGVAPIDLSKRKQTPLHFDHIFWGGVVIPENYTGTSRVYTGLSPIH